MSAVSQDPESPHNLIFVGHCSQWDLKAMLLPSGRGNNMVGHMFTFLRLWPKLELTAAFHIPLVIVQLYDQT